MTFYARSCALLLVALWPAAAQLGSHVGTAPVAKPVGRPVVRVNGAVLTDRDLLREMFTIFPYARQHNGFPKAMEPDIRKGALQMIVFEELVYQEALGRKMSIPAARMNRAVLDFHRQFPSDKDYQLFLKDEFKGNQELLRAKIQRSLLIEEMLKTEVTIKAAVTAAEAKAYYDKHLDSFRTPESFTLQTISIIPPDKATAAQLKEARRRAEDAFGKAKATKTYEEFGLLAEKLSEDNYRVMMGDHKSVDRDKLPAPVVQAALAMRPGQVSNLLQLDQAYCIFRLNAHVAAGLQKFDAVKDSLRKQLETAKTEKLRANLGRKLRATAKVEEL